MAERSRSAIPAAAVADVVAELVVDRLEAVQVEHVEREEPLG
jgi:hypothetical protein